MLGQGPAPRPAPIGAQDGILVPARGLLSDDHPLGRHHDLARAAADAAAPLAPASLHRPGLPGLAAGGDRDAGHAKAAAYERGADPPLLAAGDVRLSN